MSQLSPELTKLIRVIPSGKRLIGLPMNVEYKALAAEGKTAHGLSPVVVILEELGQVRGSQDPFVEALEKAQGAYDDGLDRTSVVEGQGGSVRVDRGGRGSMKKQKWVMN